jgi:hypothetical protein
LNCEVTDKPISRKELSCKNNRRVKSEEKEIIHEEEGIESKKKIMRMQLA